MKNSEFNLVNFIRDVRRTGARHIFGLYPDELLMSASAVAKDLAHEAFREAASDLVERARNSAGYVLAGGVFAVLVATALSTERMIPMAPIIVLAAAVIATGVSYKRLTELEEVERSVMGGDALLPSAPGDQNVYDRAKSMYEDKLAAIRPADLVRMTGGVPDALGPLG